jgi:hypothetical protein
MFMVKRPHPSATKYSSAGASKPLRVDADRVAHRLDFLVALDGARKVELDVERDDLDAALERRKVADCHHVVEPVHADALAAQPLGEPLARPLREDLVVDPRCPVLADVARLCREHDRGLPVPGQQHVGVAMDDPEARQVRHRALEPRVLGAAHDDGVEGVRVHRLADNGVATLDLRTAHHDRSNPLTSAQIARFCGVGTPCSSPNRTIPPFR